MRVIGTAGHVDHGKSTLIAALTGIHPDRLKEEREREMTIDLGFGWLTLPNGEEVGIVDVPGHRDFIENMLAGIGGIDAVMLVVAADEGVMPQTREHLAIIDLLQIPTGLIALTKTDLAPDSDWIGLLETDIRAALSGTALAGAPIMRVSAKNKTGLDQLIASLQLLLQNHPARLDLNRPRLPIDRVFTMSGFGTVVTGTLTDGSFSVGDEVEILPSGLGGRVRGLQYQSTRRLDVRLRLLNDVSAPLKHSDEVKVFLGTAETIASARILGAEELAPGHAGWIQLELRDSLVAVRGDRFIVRRPSPGETLGGGLVVDPQPKGRHKRFDESLLKSLESLAQGSPADLLLEAALTLGAATLKEIVSRSRLESEPAKQAQEELLRNGRLIPLDETLVIAAPLWNDLQAKTIQIVGEYHKSAPLRKGIPREELKSKLKLSPRIFNALMAQYASRTLLEDSNAFLSLPGHKVTFEAADQVNIERLMRRFEASPFATPSMKECQAEVGEDVLNALIEMGGLTPVSVEVVFRTNDYEAMIEKVKSALNQKDQVTLAELRDRFGTTRKYAQALLEHLDAIGVTVREGDARRLRK